MITDIFWNTDPEINISREGQISLLKPKLFKKIEEKAPTRSVDPSELAQVGTPV